MIFRWLPTPNELLKLSMGNCLKEMQKTPPPPETNKKRRIFMKNCYKAIAAFAAAAIIATLSTTAVSVYE